MTEPTTVARRSLLAGAAGAAAGLAVGAGAIGEAAARIPTTGKPPLWEQAARRGIVFGSSIATWQLEKGYPKLHQREAGLLFTEDDLLWHRLKRRPKAPLNFEPGDRIIGLAERNEQLVIAAHLAWDEGFGGGWSDEDLWDISKEDAEKLLYGVVRKEVAHYRGRVNGWVVANEVTDPERADKHGFRRTVPWYRTIGPSYVSEVFHIADEQDPGALRLINEFGFETVDERGDKPGPRRRAYLNAIDHLLDREVPVQAVGIQGHLLADGFGRKFDEKGYRAFLQEFSDRGLPVLITELDVLDEGLPKDIRRRDRTVADVYRRYLDVTLDDANVKAVVAFGLTDRYTWLDEDEPREDGAHRRPLLFDRRLRPKPAYEAVSRAFRHAPKRTLLWELERR